MADREGGVFDRTVEGTGEQENTKLAALSRAERHPQRVGSIPGVVVVSRFSNHDPIAREGGGRYGQHTGMEDEIWEAGGTVWHERRHISEDPVEFTREFGQVVF